MNNIFLFLILTYVEFLLHTLKTSFLIILIQCLEKKLKAAQQILLQFCHFLFEATI